MSGTACAAKRRDEACQVRKGRVKPLWIKADSNRIPRRNS